MNTRKKIVLLTGAGMSAESGIKTFRDSNGLWENHDVMEVASPQGWQKNPKLVLDFYNQRRSQLTEVEPNLAHKALVELEKYYDVNIITQNVDDLHERAGSSNVLHIHGRLTQARSTENEKLIYDWGYKNINIGDKCEEGSQLRPNIVWFGEAVPLLQEAISWAEESDIFIVIGTSMLVYPAAGLIEEVDSDVPKYIIDPNKPSISNKKNVQFITESATIGVSLLVKELIEKAK